MNVDGRPVLPTGSMTCAGIASVIIASGQIGGGDATVADGEVKCCGAQIKDDSVQRGLSWLGKHFSVKRNPAIGQTNIWWLYYLYAMERVGRFSGQRFIGQADWYREGAEELVSRQDRLTGGWIGTDTEAHPPIGTSLALLFLSKGRRPVLIAKMQHGETNDWNHHRHDLAHLTHHVEQRWQRNLTWQTIDSDGIKAEDLLKVPVLFLSGKDSLKLSKDQKNVLKTYVSQGGFVFAEACCGGSQFDKDFRKLAAELFPESPLRLLPQDHPVWYAEQQVDPNYLKPLYGVEACCRTSIVYCPKDLSCYWELSGRRDRKSFPQATKNETKAALAIGANVLTYATNRVLQDKLETPQLYVASGSPSDVPRATLQVAKIFHGGGSDDAPSALTNLLTISQQKLQLRINTEKRVVGLSGDELFDYPIAYMHGRRNFRFSKEEKKSLATYLENGGFLFADSICATIEFSNAFRREINTLFPDTKLEQIDPEHEMFTTEYQGFDLSSVRLRDPRKRDSRLVAPVETVRPLLEGVRHNGRLVVVFSPYDLSCALENQASLECKGYIREDAAKIGMNVILFAMQQ